MPHVDILEEREPIGRSFAGSLAFHVGIVVVIAGMGILRSRSVMQLGSENPGGGMGSIAVTPVASINLPPTEGPKNPVANDTNSLVPVAKETPKPKQPKREVKKEDPKALAVPGGFTKREYAAELNKFRQKQEDKPNQLYSTSGQQLSSEMLAKQGSGRLGLGENSPFGTQFGAYAQILRDRVAQAWNTSGIDAGVHTAPVVTVTFTLYRDGSVSGARVTRSSGISTLDRSALRAIADATPFPKVPPQFPKDRIDIDFVFELRR